MYAITDEDSFLPPLLTGNPAKQLEQVHGYYERQRELTRSFDRNLDDIRMAYCRKLCKEKERLSKSLWELEVKKRRLLHQVAQSNSRQRSDWRWKSISEAKKERQRKKTRQEGKDSMAITIERKSEIENRQSSSKREGKRQEKTSKHKSQLKQITDPGDDVERLQLPKYLLY